MPGKTFAIIALLVFVVLALVLPGQAVAGPPEGMSGKMVFDEVADGLRKYRKEEDEEKRMGWLVRLAPTRDPRVAVVLGEAMVAWKPKIGITYVELGHLAAMLLVECNYDPSFAPPPTRWKTVRVWWEKNEADLRRRAKQLPQ